MNSPKYFRHHVSQVEDCEVSVEVSRVKTSRSSQQNRYYWKCLTILAAETGHTTDELHRIFRSQFLGREKTTYRGKDYFMVRSTTSLNVSEFMEYMERISAEAAQLEITLPNPEDYYKF